MENINLNNYKYNPQLIVIIDGDDGEFKLPIGKIQRTLNPFNDSPGWVVNNTGEKGSQIAETDDKTN